MSTGSQSGGQSIKGDTAELQYKERSMNYLPFGLFVCFNVAKITRKRPHGLGGRRSRWTVAVKFNNKTRNVCWFQANQRQNDWEAWTWRTSCLQSWQQRMTEIQTTLYNYIQYMYVFMCVYSVASQEFHQNNLQTSHFISWN